MGAARSASYATELPVDQQEAVHDLVTRLQADERDAVDCVAHIVATKDLRRGVASYVASFRSVDDVTKNATRRRRGSSSANSRTLEDLQRWAGKPHSTARPAAPQTVLSRKGCPVCGHPLAADDGSCACPTPQERAS